MPSELPAPGTGWRRAAVTAWPEEPYKGLNYFTAADAPLLSERECEVEECAALLEGFATRVLLLHGLSGAGKSSFLRAGLMPRLERPPEERCRFFFLYDPTGEPLLIRATDDPVARILDALASAIRTDTRIPAQTRDEVLQELAALPDPDRKLAATRVMTALTHLTRGLRDPLVLLIDQAEEVLTLPHDPASIHNRRRGFFWLLEDLCFKRLDMRLVVSLRTEYYGQFCSFFSVSPTTALTSAHEPRSGMLDFLLRRLDDPVRIASAIRRPTLKALPPPPWETLGAPFGHYQFEYAGDLPELMATDLLKQSGDASALAVMQLVCRGLYLCIKARNGRVITTDDYNATGGVQGALDARIETAIHGALAAVGEAATLCADGAWQRALSCLVGRQDGGTITTLVIREAQLVEVARGEGISGDIPLILRTMAEEQWRILRPVAAAEGDEIAYSLGHDSLGPPLALWQERKQRLEAGREARRRLARQKRWTYGVSVSAIAVILGILAAASWVNAIVESRILNVAAVSQSGGSLRLRLLLLAASIQNSEHLLSSFVFSSREAYSELRDTLLRGPVFGGNFPAGMDAGGRRLVRLEGGKIIERNLRSTDPARADMPPVSIPPKSKNTVPNVPEGAPYAIGYVSLTNEHPDGSIVISKPGMNPEMNGDLVLTPGSTQPVPGRITMPVKFTDGQNFPPQPEIGGGSLRFLRWHFETGLVDGIDVLQVQGSAGAAFTPVERNSYALDWKPRERTAWRIPVLAEDCDRYAFTGRQDDKGGSSVDLWIGTLGGGAAQLPLLVQVARDDRAFVSTTISRGCDFALVRTRMATEGGQGALYLARLDGQPVRDHEPWISVATPIDFSGYVPMSFPQLQSPLAAARRPGGEVRAAWMVESGLALIDVSADGSSVHGFVGEPGHELPLLTGLDESTGIIRLSLSRDGDFLLMTQQRGFAATPDVRVFDLRRGERESGLANADLVKEACRVARFLPGGNQLSETERSGWLGDSRAPQPCSSSWDKL